jgi:hypothetical protein
MTDIAASFQNDYGESRRYVIVDRGRDPNSPPVIFNDYLDAGQATQPLALHSSGQVIYQRSDGAPTNIDSISDGDVISME